MTQDWAREKAYAIVKAADLEPEDQHGMIDDIKAVLKAERARARRIVRAVQKPYIVLGKQEMYDQVKREVCDEILKRLG